MLLIEYMKQRNLKPFSDSNLSGRVGVSKRYLGYIAQGKKMPSLEVALRIEEATGMEVTPRDLLNHYNAVQSGESSDLHEPLDPHDTPEPDTSPAEDAPAQAPLFADDSHDSTVSVG